MARATGLEARRNRISDSLVVFSLMVIAAALLLGQISVGQERKILVDVGLSAIRLFGTLVALFLGIAVGSQDIERRTIYLVLSKPLAREEFLLGRFIGSAITLAAYVAVMTAAVLLALTTVGRSAAFFPVSVLSAVFLLYLQILLILALALLFSTFSTPVLSAVITVALFLIGHLSSDFAHLAETATSRGVAALCRMLYYVLPNFQNFNFITAAAHGQAPSGSLVARVSLYAAVYGGLVLYGATLIFRRREFR